jgi:hypothetical protein
MNIFFFLLLWVIFALLAMRSVADPHYFDADPDEDPDPACHFDADPDPTFHFKYESIRE